MTNSTTPVFYVYKLYFSEQPSTIYIGQTNNLQSRFYNHTYTTGISIKKENWIRNRTARGWKLRISVLDTSDNRDTLSKLERDWISYHLEQGFKQRDR